MKEKFSLKDELFNPLKVRKISAEIRAVYSDFEIDSFEMQVVERFPELELKERIYHIAHTLTIHLPSDYREATTILLESLPAPLDSSKSDDDFGDFIYAPYAEFVRLHGCSDEYLEFSLQALGQISQRFSVEFAIRDFINHFPSQTLDMLLECSLSTNYHLRRLASEGLRPKLPWAKKLTIDYHLTLTHLDNLYYDPTRYVTRSVANHLNDISKLNPTLVIETLKRWRDTKKQTNSEMEYIITHSLRSLVKQGDSDALALLGYPNNPDIEVSSLGLDTQHITIGDSLFFDFTIKARGECKLIIDYIIYYKTKTKKESPKVYKIKKLTLQKDEKITIEKRHPFKANMSTRKLQEGEHHIALQINGIIYAKESFILEEKK